MAENRMHGPGTDISDGDGAVRQRHAMGEGKGPMAAGDFGVSPYPGRVSGRGHGDHMPHDGVMLHDKHRMSPPGIERGGDMMAAEAHSDHGPHHHGKEHKAREGHRPHHVGGHKRA
jgi:hypothetical protein